MRQYKTIIWDLDGTLMDTLQDLYEAVNHALGEYGMPLRTKDEVRKFLGNGMRRLMMLSIPDGDKNPKFDDVSKAFKTYYVAHCQDNTCLYPGISETLLELKRRGVRMAVVSNKMQAGVTELYNAWFRDTMDVAIGERPEVKRKPAPDMVLTAMKELGIDTTAADYDPSDIVYIGDSEVDILTAKNSGLPCISVLWGFRDKDFLLESGATTMIERPQDLL